MNIDNINRWLTLVANLGVVAGIVFLAFELHQNNENLEAQSRFTLKENRAGMNRQIAHDPGFAAILVKARSNDALSNVEQMQLNAWFRSNLANWQWDHDEYLRGSLDLNAESYRSFSRAFPQMQDMWNSSKASYTTEFQDFMDTEIIEN